jgi:tudor domain-containing protein 1/4/6/7
VGDLQCLIVVLILCLQPCHLIAEPAVQDVPKVAALNLTIGKEESVYITCVNSLGDFYCQLASTSTQLDNLMNNIEAFYRPLTAEEEAFTNPQVGNVCCARFTEDDGFYRAVVTKVSSGTIGVRYIDYGNCEELPLSRIKSLNVSFTGLRAQCFNAKTFSSSCDTTAEFEAMVIDKELKAKIVKKDENGVFVVALSDARGTPLFSQQQQGMGSSGFLEKTAVSDVFILQYSV